MNKTFSTNLFEGLPIFPLFYVVFVIPRILWYLFFYLDFFPFGCFCFCFGFYCLIFILLLMFIHLLGLRNYVQPKEEKS